MCTTVNTTRNLAGPDPETSPCIDRNRTKYGDMTKEDAPWSSCEEWCLSMVCTTYYTVYQLYRYWIRREIG